MFRKHINHKKIIACALGVILGFAPAPALISAVTVHAEENTGNWVTSLGVAVDLLGQELSDYIQTNGIIEPNALVALSTAVALQDTFYQNLKWAIDSDVEINSNGAVYSGFYRTVNNGPIYSGSIYMKNSISHSGTVVVTSQHFEMQIGFRSSNINFNGTEVNFSSVITGSSIRYSATNNADYSCICWWNDRTQYLSGTGSSTIQANTTSPQFVVSFGTTSNIPIVSGSGSSNGKTYFGSGSMPSLPDLGVPMEKANPQPYFEALQNYIRQTYPDTPSQLIPTVTASDDDVTLPTSPHIGLNAEKGHLNDLNLDLEPYSSGFDFWWWLTDSVLTDLHLRTVVLLLIALGSVGFIVWKVGR